MFRFTLFFIFFTTFVGANSLEEKIAKMVIIGFDGVELDRNISNDIKKYGIGGVILFSKNIKSPLQLKRLTASLKSLKKEKFLIATDQEGGLVQRLKSKNGFFDTPKPSEVSKLSLSEAKKLYKKMAQMLSKNGINCDFAPSVDVAINPKNPIIAKYGRSFSSDEKIVLKYASIFIEAMREEGVLSVIKHFPGHGSSHSDSHSGFVDVSNYWQERELYPFWKLIDENRSNIVMSAHIFNKNLDTKYPATLSYATNQKLLRDKMGFNGVLISDDMQMGAIAKNYDLNRSIALAINSGIDMILFGNQLSRPISLNKIIQIVKRLVEDKKISIDKIDQANRRVERMLGE
jgi:beta-N-acetylhexosaminidase